MSQLKQARREIDKADKEIVRLLCKRFKAVNAIFAHKIEYDLPVVNSERRIAVIQNAAALALAITNNSK